MLRKSGNFYRILVKLNPLHKNNNFSTDTTDSEGDWFGIKIKYNNNLNITESSNGRTTAFGAVYSGSNPGSVADSTRFARSRL